VRGFKARRLLQARIVVTRVARVANGALILGEATAAKSPFALRNPWRLREKGLLPAKKKGLMKRKMTLDVFLESDF